MNNMENNSGEVSKKVNEDNSPNTRKSLSPRLTSSLSPTPPESKDYKVMYENLRRRYKDLSVTNEKITKKALMDYNNMNEKLSELTAENIELREKNERTFSKKLLIQHIFATFADFNHHYLEK